MSRTVKRIWNTVTTVLTVPAVLLAVLLWGVRLFGMDVFVVQSGSMEPEYPVGALVYVKPVEATELAVGDVITFNLSANTRGTHRIIEIVDENGTPAFRTKGDANDSADVGLVLPADIVGKVLLSVPKLGFLVSYIRQPPGMYVAVSAVAALLLLVLLPELIFSEKSKKREEPT